MIPDIPLIPPEPGHPGAPGRPDGYGGDGGTGGTGGLGPRGPRGEPGMSSTRRRAVVILFIIAVAVAASSLLLTARYATLTRAALTAQAAAAHDSRVRAQSLLTARICESLAALGAVPPPAAVNADNPARAYERELNAAVTRVSADIGCPPITPPAPVTGRTAPHGTG